MAKATLLEPTIQVGGNFTTLNGVVLVVGVPTEISTHNAMLYMDSHNINIAFEAEDFKDIHESVLENISKKLNIKPEVVKDTVLPKAIKPKTTLTKKATEAVKSTLKAAKPKLASSTVKELATDDEETSTEESSSDE